MTDGAGSHNYTYDSLDGLTAATHPNQTNESYILDDVGNRTASHQGSSYSYQPFNRLITANSNGYDYDLSGNLTSRTEASGTWTYTWDYENRLKQASLSGGVTVNYSYDALGRRVQRTSTSSGTTKFVYDDADVLRDLDVNDATIADYLNGPGIDNKLRQISDGTASYFVADHLGTTRAITDASGSVISTLTYDSFGKVTGGSAPTRYTYTGREIDVETGLMYYRARWYDPDAGRFLSEDPIGFGGGDINLYVYVHNRTLTLIDPFGEQVRADSRWKPGEIEDSRPLADVVRRMPPPGPGFYPDMHRRRIDGHNRFPGEPNSAMRHCVVSCESAREWGTMGPRLMGIGNEGQGILLDIQRIWRRRPVGAFQFNDLLNNERGFICHSRVNGGCCKTCVECCSGPCGPAGKSTPPTTRPTAWDKR